MSASLIEINAIDQPRLDKNLLQCAFIDFPTKGTSQNGYNFKIAGWVVGRKSRVVAVEFIYQDWIVRSVPLTVTRLDISKKYPGAPPQSGFSSSLCVLGFNAKFQLGVRAVLEDHNRAPLCAINGSRVLLRSSFQPTTQPLLLTSLARSGTTWLMRVLAQHPRLVAHPAHPYETRAARYWLTTLRFLADPLGQMQGAAGGGWDFGHWWPFLDSFFRDLEDVQPEACHWLGRARAEEQAGQVQHWIESYYHLLARQQQRVTPAFFVEKHLPDLVSEFTWELYPQAREVFLIRDFRDMVCSIKAFNEKRQFQDFGRERAQTEEEFIRQTAEAASSLLNAWKRRQARAYLIRYEDLLQEPVKTLTEVLTYLGLDSGPTAIAQMLAAASIDVPELQEHRTSATPKESIGRWKRDLPTDLKTLYNRVFGPVLKEFGYEPGH